ncbi:hypothetical protein TNCV_2266401 [Trichonephila clavipes]|nr:hypothetical protein TNCV_2266401 [Trichonephila clavipes]
MNWMAHIIRTPDDTVVKKALQFKVIGIRKRARPRLRWAGFGIMNEKTWRTKTQETKIPIRQINTTKGRRLVQRYGNTRQLQRDIEDASCKLDNEAEE